MKIKKILSSFFLFYLSLFFIACLFGNPTYGQDSGSPIIETIPPKIDIAIKVEDISKIPDATVSITARQANLTSVTINSTDIFEEQNRRLWISAETINSNKNNFSLTLGHTVDIKLIFNITQSQEPGSYVGKIIIRSENGGFSEIPLTIKLRRDDFTALLWISFGVIASLIINISRWHIGNEDSTKATIELADTALFKAEDENRKDYRYLEAKELKTQYDIDFENGDYKDAKEKAIKAKFLSERASTKPPTPHGIDGKSITPEDLLTYEINQAGPISELTALKIAPKAIVDTIKTKSPNLLITTKKYQLSALMAPPSWRTQQYWTEGHAKNALSTLLKKGWGFAPTKKQFLVYASVLIIILVIMAQAWEAFYPRITDFGASLIDYITAFLYGFSGQSFLSAFADLGKRWMS